MEFRELIRARYSCRKFASTPIPQEKLDAVLEAGRIAPTGHNGQPQRILVAKAGTETYEKIKECTACHFDAPVILVSCFEKGTQGHEYEDLAIVMTHIMLAAFDEGLADIWVQLVDFEKLRVLLNIPENYHIVGLMPMGYPREDARPSRLHSSRKDLSETVFYDHY